MTYQDHIVKRVKAAPATLGPHLGRWAVRKDFSVQRIAQAIGVTRAVVYRWFAGQTISPALRYNVNTLIEILKAAPDADAAWSQACATFPHLQRSQTKNSAATRTSNSLARTASR